MKQVIDEQLSAFLDGELPSAEEQLLLRRLERETGYQERLVRYAVIGQLIRGESAISGGEGLARRISGAIAEEPPHAAAAGPRKWASLAPMGLAAAAGLVVLAGLVSLGTGPVPEAPRVASVPTPQIRTADFQSPADAPIEPARLTSYLVAHGDYAGGLARPAVSSHVVNGTPEFLKASASRGRFDE